ncbi:Epoxyqueuosine reductase [hydrothermal vent metagenome]|uniref:Epoxyqueuosine reductase n=1 Tax=hydrothermal vent metagenome TaxID=652676 RepID=A0A3B0XY78_9ZZZZ
MTLKNPPSTSEQTEQTEQTPSAAELAILAVDIKTWASSLGFQDCGICDTNLFQAEQRLFDWLDNNYHGEMHYMAKHGTMRSRPAQLLEGTRRIISVRMNYWPEDDLQCKQLLQQPEQAYISRYALGRDYHKLMRQRLQKLANKIEDHIGPFGYRVFVDSAPVLEKAIAEKAGLGWIGKHSNLISTKTGSLFFLGEIYTDLSLPIDSPATDHCGDCTACIDACPSNAIVAPYVVDARKCISYFTIELRESIPLELRPMMGNRIYGCDDCQLVCPWNRFTKPTDENDFQARQDLDSASLLRLLQWSEQEFLKNTEGSAIRRIGYECWQRNIAVALGNCEYSDKIMQILKQHYHHPSELVREHIHWALAQQKDKM